MSLARYATVLMGCAAITLAACGPDKATDAAAKVARGKYLVAIMSCTDCHTPGALMGQPNMAKFLGGSDVGFFQPGVGYFYGPNLTSDQETGLGKWREDEIVTVLRTGKRPDGRILSPIMPWMSFATLTDDDANAIAAYLKSLPPISNKVIGPFGPNETPTGPYQAVTMPQGAAPQLPPPTEVPTVRPPRPVD
jgi:mono/diheme cytochrome c family protein